jgi:hypothetical protein
MKVTDAFGNCANAAEKGPVMKLIELIPKVTGLRKYEENVIYRLTSSRIWEKSTRGIKC